MAATATTPTTTPTAMPTVLEPPDLCPGVADADCVDCVWLAACVTTTVLPGVILVTTEGAAEVVDGVFEDDAAAFEEAAEPDAADDADEPEEDDDPDEEPPERVPDPVRYTDQ